MKKALLVIGIILVAFSIMAPGPPDKAEKLKVNDQDFDRQWDFDYLAGSSSEGTFTLKVNMLLHHGIANATMKNGKFTILVTAVDVDGNHWDTTNPVAVNDEDWDREAVFVPLTGIVEWNGDDDGSQIIDGVAVTLLGPSGKAIGSTLTLETGGVFIYGPEYEEPPGCGDEIPTCSS